MTSLKNRLILVVVSDEYSFASQLAVLQGCHTVISRLLRRSGSSLLAAKILVISRLLHKSLASSTSPAPLVDTLRDKLASLRVKLLNYIDTTFADPNAQKTALVESMHAFCLATSSTPTDVLRHFHKVRSKAISEKVWQGRNVCVAILEAMKLFISTLQDTQAIFPRRLATALETTKVQPLLQDPSIVELPELQLDIHGRWIAEDIRQFTPRPRHDQLQRSDAEALLRSWAAEAMKSFLSGLRQVLGPEKDFTTLVQIRRELLELWLSSLQPSSTSEAADVLDDLREVMMERIAEAMRGRTANLRFVSQSISYTILHWQPGVANAKIALWDPAVGAMDVGSGAVQGIQNILDRCHGRSTAVNEVLTISEDWMQSIQEAQNTIKKMKDTRWDENPDDIADEILPELPQILLSNKDPKALEDMLRNSVSDAFRNLRQELDNMEKTLVDEQQSGEKSAFVLRILRELRQRMSKLGVALASSFSASLHETSVEATCRGLLASSVCNDPVSSFHKSIERYLNSPHSPARALWEGNPPLPAQPSPAVFKFLRALMSNMESAGHDLWNPTTVHAMKVHLFNARTSELLEMVDTSSMEEKAPLTNGHHDADGSEEANSENEDPKGDENTTNEPQEAGDDSSQAPKSPVGSPESYIQLLFDVFYLRDALHTKVVDLSGNYNQEEQIFTELSEKGSIDKAARQRLEKSATDYWKKTYLLFALLA